MRLLTLPFSICALVIFTPGARAGLYYSGESYAALPAQWRGFLLDQRALRNIAMRSAPGQADFPLRLKYQRAAETLQKRLDEDRKLPPADWADLGALYVRLGEPAKAVEVLRGGQRVYPNHFFIAANLGTAWQLAGDLGQAALALQEAVRLAPGKLLQAEEYHLKLVRARLKQGTSAVQMEHLFSADDRAGPGEGKPAQNGEAESKRLPTRSVAIAQQLALWLPADGRLLWQLAELAAAHGDVTSAAAMADGCVLQFGMTSPALRRRRQQLRAAADALANAGPKERPDHTKHVPTLAFRSARPLATKIDAAVLPPIRATGSNPLPWELFAETTVAKPFRPVFPEYLKQLQDKQVVLTGFMYPLRDEPTANAFMFIENPVGCWYCEMPDTTGVVYVEMPAGQTFSLHRGIVRVTGRLTLNATDPEDFLYAVRDARVSAVD